MGWGWTPHRDESQWAECNQECLGVAVQRFWTGSDFVPTSPKPGDVWRCLGRFWLLPVGVSWIKLRVAAEHPTMYRLAPHKEESSSPNGRRERLRNAAFLEHVVRGKSRPTKRIFYFCEWEYLAKETVLETNTDLTYYLWACVYVVYRVNAAANQTFESMTLTVQCRSHKALGTPALRANCRAVGARSSIVTTFTGNKH